MAETDANSYSRPSPKKAAAAPAAPHSTSARADFLRSLGIENAGEVAPSPPPRYDAPTRNATGSQEYCATSSTPTIPMGRSFSGSVKKRSMVVATEEETFDAPSYSNPVYASASNSDLIRGKNVGPQPGPKNTSLNAELVGLPADASAVECKNLGNKFFESGDYRKSIRLYARAIDVDPSNAALYSNRSAAYLLGGKQMGIDTRNMSLRDADKAIKLRPTWFKGYSRRGDALFKKECFRDAIEAYETALDLDPTNKSIHHSLGECRQLAGNKGPQAWTEKSTNKSAYELLDEFNEQRERDTPSLATSGADFRSQQLESFRQQKTPTNSGSVAAQSAQWESPVEEPVQQQQPRESIPEEFNSRAAAAYQSSLLDAYRRKKATKAAY
jgi:tetratricopeptide (TPR) repeat protein